MQTFFKNMATTTVIFTVAFLCAPFFTNAQDTEQATPATSSMNVQIPTSDELNQDSESIEHERISLSIGVRTRISSSPASYEDLDISASSAINEDYLEVFLRHIALSEPVGEMTVGSDEIEIEVDGPAELFGFIPVSMPYNVVVEYDSGLESVKISYPAGWSWLATKKPTDEMTADIAATIGNAEYLSSTQLSAYVVEAIISAVRG